MYRIGIDLGGTNIKMVITDENSTIIQSLIRPTNASEGPDRVLERMANMVLEITNDSKCSLKEITAVGMGIPGQVYGPAGPVLHAPNIHWENVDPVGYFQSRLHLELHLANDADCVGLAENAFGAGRPYHTFLLLVLGTGVGGSIIHEGKIFSGFGPFGGEYGHIPLVHGGHPCACGLKGCFEQYASATAFHRIALESGVKLDPARNDLGTQVFDQAAAGIKEAITARDSYVHYLSEGITGLIHLFRPEAVILGGGVACTGQALLDQVNETLCGLVYASNLVPPPPVLAAELGMFSGAVGASLL